MIQRHNESAGPLFLEVALSAPHTGNPGCAMLQVRDEVANDVNNAYISDTQRRLYAGNEVQDRGDKLSHKTNLMSIILWSSLQPTNCIY